MWRTPIQAVHVHTDYFIHCDPIAVMVFSNNEPDFEFQNF